VNEHARLAGSGARENQDRSVGQLDGAALLFVEVLEEVQHASRGVAMRG